MAACWLLFFWELRGEWGINPQYNYGYLVPLLGAMLIGRRWPERPAAQRGSSRLVMGAGLALLVLLLPIELIREANPEWRMLYWFHGALMMCLSACLLYRVGGWKWAKFFAPPLAFMLIAVPWPMEWEQSIIQGLMRFVAGLTIQVAGWLGIPAVQHGNLIEVANGIVGINEACSGVRSLQSSLMLSLFLGEMNRFSAARRIVLIGASMVCVLLANVARTTFLTWAAANRGFHQMESWHDTAGLLVMIIVLPSLFLLAHWMKPKTGAPPEQPANFASVSIPWSRWVPIGVLLWLGFCVLATEFWYRSHERNLVYSPRWTIAWPVDQSHFKKSAVPDESLAILRCSDSESALWQDEEDNQWSAFFLRWKAGENSVQLAKGHRPDVCFPATGAKLVESHDYVTAKVGDLSLPFKYQTFQSGDQLLHVFYCLWSDCASVQPDESGEGKMWRLRAFWHGERNLGQQIFEVVITGPETSEAAVARFQADLPHLIHRE